MIPRLLEHSIYDRLTTSDKVVVIYGARQVGKTTLSQKVLSKVTGRVLRINADHTEYVDILSSKSLETLKGLVSGYQVLFIDEAQRIPNIGLNLKILHDGLPELKIIVTGSSSFDLAERVKEPLTGRSWTYKLYPISIDEWKTYKEFNDFELRSRLGDFMRFGLYPEVLLFENYTDKREYLKELSSAYLYKDILALANIRYPKKLQQLLKLLAYQISNLISIHELAIALQVNRDTVIHYLDLLEKAFVIFRLSGFSRNLRKEVTKMDKIYFYDLGIRNAIIENFDPLNLRTDTGALWENLLITERLKRIENKRTFANKYFWRTHSGAELDYVEETGGRLYGYEFKWKSSKRRIPDTWLKTYKNASCEIIDKENFVKFI